LSLNRWSHINTIGRNLLPMEGLKFRGSGFK
jgi:hypothetical protein